MQQNLLSSGPEGATVTASPKTSVDAVGAQTGSRATCTTDFSGTCDFGYSSALPGADEITVCIDGNRSFEIDVGERREVATKAWAAPAATPGAVSGGGYIGDLGRRDRVVFGLTAHAADFSTAPTGSCSVIDRVTHENIRCLDATTVVVAGTHATFFGEADQDGIATYYRIDVDDLSGDGMLDTFKIQTRPSVQGRGHAHGEEYRHPAVKPPYDSGPCRARPAPPVS